MLLLVFFLEDTRNTCWKVNRVLLKGNFIFLSIAALLTFIVLFYCIFIFIDFYLLLYCFTAYLYLKLLVNYVFTF